MLRSPYGMSRPSVVCLSSVTFVRRAQRFELFVNIFAPPNSSVTGAVCINFFWKKNSNLFQVIVQVK